MSLKVTRVRELAKTRIDVHQVWYVANLHFAMDSELVLCNVCIRVWNVRVVIGFVSNLSCWLLFGFRQSTPHKVCAHINWVGTEQISAEKTRPIIVMFLSKTRRP